eukprot:scaffold229104_cov41-Tisochrysis_lutea.AAC.1
MELLKAAETRFASTLLMITRYKNVHFVLEQLVIDPVFSTWVQKLPSEQRGKAADCKRIIRSEELLGTITTGIAIMEPVYRLLRLTDGKLGANLGKVYAYLLQIDQHFKQGVLPGVSASVRHKIHELFMARWEYLHAPVMTAAYCLEPEFCRRRHSSRELQDLKQCLRQMATDEHPLPDLLAELGDFQEAVLSGMHDFTDEVAFSQRARSMASYKWAN